jgi:hypothetical protein
MNYSEIVIVSDIDWSFVKQRHQQFAEMFAKDGVPVTWLNRLGSRNLRASDIIKYVKSKFFNNRNSKYRSQKAESIKYKKIFLLPFRGWAVDFINNFLLKNQIYVNKNTLIIHYLPQLWIVDAFKDARHIFECVNRFTSDPSINHDNFKKFLDKMDLIITDSRVITADINALGYRSVEIGPGVSNDFFNISEDEVQEKCLFFGHLRQDNDLAVIRELRAYIQVDGVGLDSTGQVDKDLFDYWYGQLPREQLPLLIKKYKYLILPYISDEYQEGIIPAKFYEALATSRIVLVSGLNRALTKDEENSIVRLKGEIKFPMEKSQLMIDSTQKALMNKLWEDRYKCLKEAIKHV